MTKQICEVCGNEYNFIEGDTPDKYSTCCSDECLKKNYDNGSEQADEMIAKKEHQLNNYLDEIE